MESEGEAHPLMHRAGNVHPAELGLPLRNRRRGASADWRGQADGRALAGLLR